MIVPQARILNAAQSLATRSYAFVGSAEAEMELTDSVTDVLLAEAVDQGAGGLEVKGAASFQWGDAQNVMDLLGRKDSGPNSPTKEDSPAELAALSQEKGNRQAETLFG